MTAVLLDEMCSVAAAVILRERYGHDAVQVSEVGRRATADADIAAVARAERRALVTENVADFAAERDLVFVLKRSLAAGGGQAAALAALLHLWATESPTPTSGATGRREPQGRMMSAFVSPAIRGRRRRRR